MYKRVKCKSGSRFLIKEEWYNVLDYNSHSYKLVNHTDKKWWASWFSKINFYDQIDIRDMKLNNLLYSFPLKDFKYKIPKGEDFGAFAVKRKYDIHTGIDLYCEEDSEVFAIEDGEIVKIDWFTGEKIDMPWWNNTMAIAISGHLGVIVYGELLPINTLKVGDKVNKGDLLGFIKPVLKTNKGKVPSTSMLHLELFSEFNGEWIEWNLDKTKPENLLDPTEILESLLNNNI